jgi:hypothetical protein
MKWCSVWKKVVVTYFKIDQLYSKLHKCEIHARTGGPTRGSNEIFNEFEQQVSALIKFRFRKNRE